MLLYFGMLLLPFGCGLLYLRHSAKRGRRGQAASIGALLLLLASASAVLLWEFLAAP